MAERIQLRRGTAALWTSKNTVLGQGELGVETDTGKAKLGDGVTAWSSLPYSAAPVGVAGGAASLDPNGLLPLTQVPRHAQVVGDPTGLPDAGSVTVLSDGTPVTDFGNSPISISGGLFTHNPGAGTNRAGYLQADLGENVYRIGCEFVASGASTNFGSVTLVIPSSAWSDALLTNAGVHCVYFPNGIWHVSRYVNGVGETIYASDTTTATYGRFADLRDGAVHAVEVILDEDKSALTLIGPDGRAVRVAYPYIATETSQYAVWEIFNPDTSIDTSPKIRRVWAEGLRKGSATDAPSYILAGKGLAAPAANIQSLAQVAALPQVGVAQRGQVKILQGGSGVADGAYLVLKNAAGAYTWIEVVDRNQLGVAGGAASLDGGGKVPVGQVPDQSNVYMSKDAACTIDLCKAPYNATPGQDVTTALQNAINALVATGLGGRIYFSSAGTYLLNGAPQAGAALGYSYKGQVLFPGTPYASQPAIPITIEGAYRPNGGLTPNHAGSGDGSSTGAPNGVILLSNGPSGAYVFDTVPGEMGWGLPWTGVMPIFKNIIVRSPSNPANGGINLQCALRCELDKTIIDTVTSWLAPTNVTTALVLPQHFNNGDISVIGEIHGYYRAVQLSEHAVFPKLDINNCRSAFYCTVGGHANWLGYVDVEEVGALFEVNGATLNVYGTIDMENVQGGVSNFPNTLLIDGPASGRLAGELSIFMDAGTTNGSNNFAAAMGANATANSPVSISINGRPRTASTFPSDNFYRMNNVAQTNGAGAPGMCNPTGHVWRGAQTVSVPSNGTLAFTAAGQLLAPSKNEPRAITVKANVTTAPVIALMGQYLSGSSIWFGLHGPTTVQMGIGTSPIYGANVASITVPTVANTAVTLTLEIYYADGVPSLIKGKLNGVTVIAYQLTTAQQATFALPQYLGVPEIEDGFYCNDTAASFTSFAVKPAPASNSVISGTATLAAGAVTVANAFITANSVVRLSRQAAGGTLGLLSVAVTAGTGFTINSSSNTDTSTVYYEVVSY